MMLLNLPNQTPAPNENNLTAEAEKYIQLYNNLNITTSGVDSFVSSSSGKTYTTNDYPSDKDVYNKGQTGIMNLLYKYVLNKYIITAEVINGIGNNIDNINSDVTKLNSDVTKLNSDVTKLNSDVTKLNSLSNSILIDASTITFDSTNKIFNIVLTRQPPSTFYSVRFRAPSNYVAGSKIKITYSTSAKTYTPMLSSSLVTPPTNTFIKDRVITANVDVAKSIITLESSATSPLVKSTTAPTSSEDKTKLWVNTSNKTLNYWDGSKWVSMVGVWG